MTVKKSTVESQGRVRREKTISMRQLKREHVELPQEMMEWVESLRPKTRSECRDGLRPCPYVACKYNLYLDVNPNTGSLKLNFPGMEVWELKETCALDVAERGGVTLEEVGVFMNLTRERIRQVESTGKQKMLEEIQTQKQELIPV
jgi:hypothetical protein